MAIRVQANSDMSWFKKHMREVKEGQEKREKDGDKSISHVSREAAIFLQHRRRGRKFFT